MSTGVPPPPRRDRLSRCAPTAPEEIRFEAQKVSRRELMGKMCLGGDDRIISSFKIYFSIKREFVLPDEYSL
jgi:hypothetical protein